MTAQAPVAVPKPRPAHVQSPLKTFIAPHGEKHHTVEPEPTQPGEPNPHELPNPVWPVVPNYAPNELGTLYKTQVESVGFTDVEITTVPEIDIDTSVGPDDVVTVVPSVGTAADPSTKVDIAVNPADAPVPEGKKSVLSGPTEPGFKFPDFGVLCKGFPFGVPCWLAKTVESWSVTGKAPELGTEEIEIDHRKIPPGLFDLSHLEPEMEIIRPAMVIFATIGLVLLFYKFAKGGSAPSGSNSDSSGGEGGDS